MLNRNRILSVLFLCPVIILSVGTLNASENKSDDRTKKIEIVLAPDPIVAPGSFYRSLDKVFDDILDSYYGLNRHKIDVNEITTGFIDRIKRNKVKKFLKLSDLFPGNHNEAKDVDSLYIGISKLFERGLGLSGHHYFIVDAMELRYLPSTLEGTNILILTNDTKVMSSERVKLVLEAAQMSKIKISTVWYGGQDKKSLSHRKLYLDLAKETGGKFVDIGDSLKNSISYKAVNR